MASAAGLLTAVWAAISSGGTPSVAILLSLV
jgi:hypothetical protein